MSMRNGDKARTNTQRRKRIVQRMKARAIRAGASGQTEAPPAPAPKKPSRKQTA